MRKVCTTSYKIWLEHKSENSNGKKRPTKDSANIFSEDYFFTKISKKDDFISSQDRIFVAIKMPANAYIYEWFQKDVTFKILKNFVLSMDVYHEIFNESRKKFTFVDLIYQKYEFLDDQPISIVFEKEKEAIEKNEKPDTNIRPSDRIFLKVKLPQKYKKLVIVRKKC